MRKFLLINLLIFVKFYCGNSDKTIDSRTEVLEVGNLFIPEWIKSFDTIGLDSVISVQFELMNQGTGKVEILEVSPDCLCSSYSLSKNVLYSGERSVLQIEFNSSGKVGDIKQTTVLTVTNSNNKFYKVILKGYVSST